MGNLGLFLLQLGVILRLVHLAGAGFRRIGQPRVVGEMAAGFALGPTIFGTLASQGFRLVFPSESLAVLTAFAQAGMAIFLFLAGMRVDFAELRRQSRITTATAIGSVVVPFVAGLILAEGLYPRYGRGDRCDFALFLGVAMSVTAFPVLARILSERRLLDTPLGATAIAAAAFDDVAAWIMLALLFGSSGQAGRSQFWLGLLVFAMLATVLRSSSRGHPGAVDFGWTGAVPAPLSLCSLHGAVTVSASTRSRALF
jgi:Kef-type K+ transport system membrane component KefB